MQRVSILLIFCKQIGDNFYSDVPTKVKRYFEGEENF